MQMVNRVRLARRRRRWRRRGRRGRRCRRSGNLRRCRVWPPAAEEKEETPSRHKFERAECLVQRAGRYASASPSSVSRTTPGHCRLLGTPRRRRCCKENREEHPRCCKRPASPCTNNYLRNNTMLGCCANTKSAFRYCMALHNLCSLSRHRCKTRRVDTYNRDCGTRCPSMPLDRR